MHLPGHPERIPGFAYDEPGRAYHCRLGCFDRAPHFADLRLADLVVEALKYRHGKAAEILTYCVMPDHLHVLVSLVAPGTSLSRWVGDLKRWVIRAAQAEGLPPLRWQPNFFEHVIRRDEDLIAVAKYILANPIRAGLVERWQDYRWCGSFAWQLEE